VIVRPWVELTLDLTLTTDLDLANDLFRRPTRDAVIGNALAFGGGLELAYAR